MEIMYFKRITECDVFRHLMHVIYIQSGFCSHHCTETALDLLVAADS